VYTLTPSTANLLKGNRVTSAGVSVLCRVGLGIGGWYDRLRKARLPRIHPIAVLPLENLTRRPVLGPRRRSSRPPRAQPFDIHFAWSAMNRSINARAGSPGRAGLPIII